MYDNETNRSQGERAADNFLAQQLPPHGRHAGPHDPGTTVRGDGGGSFVIPSRAVVTAEKSGAVIEAKQAINVQRRGRIEHAEGITTRDQNVERTFAESFKSVRATAPGQQFYAVQPSGTRSPLADGHDSGNPTWASAQDPAINFDFMHGTATERANGNIPPLRPGSTPLNHTDLSRLDLTSKPRQSFGKVYGSDAKQVRHNEAEVI